GGSLCPRGRRANLVRQHEERAGDGELRWDEDGPALAKELHRQHRAARVWRRAVAMSSRILPPSSASKDLCHRPALGELVDELVEIADLAHQRFFDLLDPHAA